MNIQTTKTPAGWQAIDLDSYDGPESDIGRGETEQEAIDDLCEAMGLPYSMKKVYRWEAVDTKPCNHNWFRNIDGYFCINCSATRGLPNDP